MLVHLSVHNYAIVEHLDLELDRGIGRVDRDELAVVAGSARRAAATTS